MASVSVTSSRNDSSTASLPATADAEKAASVGENERRRLTGRAGIVAAGTLSSRVLGLVRDQVIAAMFARAATDAFFVAFTIPNVLRQLLAEGAVQNAVLPVLESVRLRDGDEEARRFFAALRGLSLLILSLVTVVGIWAAPLIVDLFAAGYRSYPGQYERTVLLTRWLFPYIFWMGTAALGVAALNVHRRFVVTSFAPALLNVAFIASSLILPAWLISERRDPVLALAVGALVGGLLQVVAQWPSLAKIGYWIRPVFRFTNAALSEVLRRMGPVLFGVGIYYIDVVLARRFLSELGVGAQSYFGWALRLCDFPQGIFVMALQSATLPSLALLVARNEMREAAKTFAFSLRLTLFVALPATVACVALSRPITVLLFQRGQFDALSSAETARALVAQGAGIWMVAAVRQLVAMYYALGDTRTPVRVAAVDLCVFVLLALVLRGPLGHVGIGIAVTGSSFAQLCMLAIALRSRLPKLHLREIMRTFFRTLMAASGAALVARVLVNGFGQSAAGGALSRATPGLIAVVSFVVIFLLLARLLRCDELATIVQAIRRGRRGRASQG